MVTAVASPSPVKRSAGRCNARVPCPRLRGHARNGRVEDGVHAHVFVGMAPERVAVPRDRPIAHERLAEIATFLVPSDECFTR